ncbi:hypothetical protein HYFRA_00004025 [Hymenoscyphus fraxineus]|uniref:Uncharacterized protein n=1 Tax=Hymenoscyphus fraxineus TaxID=746836 RepID=A0A9N9KQE3_9HELO|nr:hypothetical protein HYFRA_00004025 [Hymenoscyphus fraxineus]
MPPKRKRTIKDGPGGKTVQCEAINKSSKRCGRKFLVEEGKEQRFCYQHRDAEESQDSPGEGPVRSPKGLPEANPTGSPKGSSKASPKRSPRGISKASPKGSPKGISEASPKSSPRGISEASPKGRPKGRPKGISEASPKSNPEGLPKPDEGDGSDKTSEASPKQRPKTGESGKSLVPSPKGESVDKRSEKRGESSSSSDFPSLNTWLANAVAKSLKKKVENYQKVLKGVGEVKISDPSDDDDEDDEHDEHDEDGDDDDSDYKGTKAGKKTTPLSTRTTRVQEKAVKPPSPKKLTDEDKAEMEFRLNWKEKDTSQPEGQYYLYRYKRNLWRQEALRANPDADITDKAYRRAQDLPVYGDDFEFNERFTMRGEAYGIVYNECNTRHLYTAWTMEEKRAMKDKTVKEGNLIDQQEEKIAKRFASRNPPVATPGVRDFKRAQRLKRDGKELTEDQKYILENWVDVYLDRQAAIEQEELIEAHEAITRGEIDQKLLQLDIDDAKTLQEKAWNDTAQSRKDEKRKRAEKTAKYEQDLQRREEERERENRETRRMEAQEQREMQEDLAAEEEEERRAKKGKGKERG